MAIIGVRSDLKKMETLTDRRTGLIWLLNNGTVSLESHRNVGLANLSSSVLGKALTISSAVGQADARKIPQASNDRAVAA